MARASSTKSWLWHQRLSHLNFDTINDLSKNDLVSGLLKFKYHKEHLCRLCEQGKSKRVSHPPKPVSNSRQRLHLLHMDLCGPMRIASINRKRKKQKSISSTKTSFKFKAEITSSSYGFVWTNENCQYKWKAVCFGDCGRLLSLHVEAARTMLIFSRAPLFLWAEAIATACFTQNRSIIHRRFKKKPYELINGRKLDISFLHVFSALCYPKNDREDIGKLGAKGDIGFFIGSKHKLQSMTSGQISLGLDLTYSPSTIITQQPAEGELDLFFEAMYDDYIGGQPVFNRRTKKIMETMNVSFDELSAMDFEQHNSKPGLQSMTFGQISLGLDLTYAPSTTSQQPTEGNLKLLINFVWKFLGTVRFGNDHVAAILGFGDLQWGNILITRVYFVRDWVTTCSRYGSFVIHI
nr:retrovirus-related Pol polyprotein from transposon TNT 1-94 [Tanacetum cinerariifolium]